MKNNVVQRKNMKLKYKLFLVFTILFSTVTFVLGIISLYTSSINKTLDKIVLCFTFITFILSIITMMRWIDPKNIYIYKNLEPAERASI
tara:strand:+ start:66 stop:332 length:267 start_codon:yes stop_codon:yes gene_type:complete